MNHGPLLFLGVFFSMVISFAGLVLGPQLTVGSQPQVPNAATNALGEMYPAGRAGLAREGAEIYRSLGCAECHTRQVRGLGGDLKRAWGPRITVAQDYLGDYPVMLGDLRVGPDLANVGLRQPDPKQLYLHLYAPRAVTPRSIMPPYRYLFEERKLLPGRQRSEDALAVEVKPGYEIVPTQRARALVAYLRSQEAVAPLFEAPLPLPPKPPEAPGTNAPGAPTNAPQARLQAPKNFEAPTIVGLPDAFGVPYRKGILELAAGSP